MGRQLTNKPLVEALLEVKWALREIGPGTAQDPGYPLFVGRFYEQVKDIYGLVEVLPAVQVPDQITAHIVKYRFRKGPDAYPLVQTGPGVATLNFNDDYVWEKFLPAAIDFQKKLLASYSLGNSEPPKFTSFLLRYINAVHVPEKNDLVDFLSRKLNTVVSIPESIAKSREISGSPQGFMLNIAYPLDQPNATGILRMASGSKNNKPALVWEVNIHSIGDAVPQAIDDFEKWLVAAHEVVENWFFSMIKGDLEKEFGVVLNGSST